MTQYENYIFISKYSRWLPEQNRRETWSETVDRYINYMCDVQLPGKIPSKLRSELNEAIYNREVMPSMRCLMTAGEALAKDNAAGFNCSALVIDSVQSFAELMYLLSVGSGVGFSVERCFVDKLPEVPSKFSKTRSVIHVEDSRIGWAESLRELMGMLYIGVVPTWDVSNVRPKGARLKTFGGRASGPGPLEHLFRFIIKTFKSAAGRRLNSLECHDICCVIAGAIVSGGVRRSATISLSDLEDNHMRDAKSGNWHDTCSWRELANNSAVYHSKPTMECFMAEWLSLMKSRSGERGIINREALTAHAVRSGRRDSKQDFLVNPCAEIILRPYQQCNLSEVVCRADDTEESIKSKIKLATILGTMQATLTNFRYLRPIWKHNAEEEALLGVSLSGIMDSKLMSGRSKELADMLVELKDYCIEVNKKWAEKLGINPATAVTTVKPSGTVSQLCNCSPGIHARYSSFYLRRVREGVTSPVSRLLIDCGVPYEIDHYNDNQYVFEFPERAPEGSVVVKSMGAIKQLELWKLYRNNWTEHQPSTTIYIAEDEWLAVGAWVYKHFDIIGGLSFFPTSDHVYSQPPYQEISEEEYNRLVSEMPDVDWSRLSEFEQDGSSVSVNREYACAGGACAL